MDIQKPTNTRGDRIAQKNKLEVKNLKIDEIHPYENNPRFNKDAVSKVAADLNEKQAKALRLADNKVAEFSTWDYLKLDEELKGLGDAFDFADFGFGGALADDSFGAGNSAGGSFVETDDRAELDKFLARCIRATGSNEFALETSPCAVEKIRKGTRWDGYYTERLIGEMENSKYKNLVLGLL